MLKYYLHRSWSTKHHAASGFFSVLLAVGICTRLWFRSLDEHELGLRGSLASLIYEEAACLVRPETRSPVVWKVMKSSYSRQGCGFMEYAAGAQPTATVHTKQQRRFLPSVPDQQMRFLSPFWLVAQSLDVRPDINLGCFTADVPSGWRWQTALTLLSNINTPTTVQGGIALLCPVLSKPALKSSAVLLVWVKILIPRVLALSGFLWKKSTRLFNSAELLYMLRMCCFCCWVVKIKKDPLVFGSLFRILVQVLTPCGRTGNTERKMIAFIVMASCPFFPKPPNRSTRWLRRFCCPWFYYKLSGIVFINFFLRHWPPWLPPYSSSQLCHEDEQLWLSLVVSFWKLKKLLIYFREQRFWETWFHSVNKRQKRPKH